MLLPMAVLLIVVGLVPVMLAASLGWKLVGVAVIAIAAVLLGIAMGLQRSAAADETAQRESDLDAAIRAATPCGSECEAGGCGVDDCAVKALGRG